MCMIVMCHVPEKGDVRCVRCHVGDTCLDVRKERRRPAPVLLVAFVYQITNWRFVIAVRRCVFSPGKVFGRQFFCRSYVSICI